MYICFKKNSNCDVCNENIGIKCNLCNYYLCETCFNKWYLQNHSQNKIFNCPQCRSEKTYKWRNKTLPITLDRPVSNENHVVTIFNNEDKYEETSCTIYNFDQFYNICFIVIVIIFLAFVYFLISYGTCLNENKEMCWYCIGISLILPILPLITINWILKKKEVSENILVFFSILESFLMIVLFSKKIVSCLWESEIIFFWMLLLCPCLTIINMKSSYVKGDN